MLVAQHKSFTAAAEALDLPRANVSRRIGDLENELSCRLFTRTTRRLSLTPSGNEYLRSIENLVAPLEAANEAIKNQAKSPTGHIRLGLIGDADMLVHNFLQKFLKNHPLITLETHVSNLCYHDIMTFGLDACLHIGEVGEKSFIARPFNGFVRKLYASPSYIAQNGLPSTLDDLKEHFLINHRMANGELENCWQFEHENVQIDCRLTSNNSDYVRYAVLKGAGISLLVELNVLEDVKAGRLVEVLPEYRSKVDNIWLVYPDRSGLSHAARLLIDYLSTEVEKLPRI